MQWINFALCFVVTNLDLTSLVNAQYGDYEYPDYGDDPDPCITGLNVSGTSGTIQSLDYPSTYLSSENCNWAIKASEGKRIAVKFYATFSIESNAVGGCIDVLSFNDNGTIRQLCGTDTPSSFLSAMNELSVNFVSNGNTEASGFSFNWTAVDSSSIPKISHSHDMTNEGTISSSNYPSGYANFDSSMWHVTVNAGKYIHIQFNSIFEMETGAEGKCPYDSLVLYEGNAPDSTKILQTLCSLPNGAIVFKTNQITLLFTSDSTVTGKGFSLKYTAIDPEECGSPILVNETSGVVSSPYYPISYEDNLSCMWNVRAPEGQRIAMRFNTPFDIKYSGTCTSDFLKLFDGPSTQSKQFLEDFCGKNAPRGVLTSTNELTVIFRSGTLAGNAVGFSFNWTAEVECASNQFQCWDGSCVPLAAKCDGKNDCPKDTADEAECAQAAGTRNCGNQSIAPEFFWEYRMVGGSVAKQGSWPWQVSLTTSGSPFCAGVLVSDEWVLSAAHCFLKGNSITAILGDYNTTDIDTLWEQRILVDQVIIHPGYQYSNSQAYLSGSDLALLHLSVPAKRTTWVQPACLPDTPISEGDTLVTTGWGQSSIINSGVSDILRQVRLLAPTTSECVKYFTSFSSGPYASGILCLTPPGAGMGPCQGDSGAPAVRVKNSSWEVIGIVSFSTQCKSSGLPTYFTDVLAFSSYIQQYSSGRKVGPVETRAVITDESGSLSIPSSGDDSAPNYPQNILRQWFISVPENKRITVRFSDSFKIEFGGEFCPYDYLRIYDGAHTSSVTYLDRKFCGSHPPPDFESTSNSIIVEFYSDTSYEETGFSLSWSTGDDCKASEFRCGNRTCIDASLKCDGSYDCADGSDEITCKLQSTSATQCGVPDVAAVIPWYPLISGGTNAVEGSWPWQIALYETESGAFVCGASLIDNRWALTAASCLDGTKTYKVSLGDYDLGYASVNEKRIDVSEATQFPAYKGSGSDDIATLMLSEAVTYTKWIKPICLPAASETSNPVPGTTCMLTGWGVTASGSGRSGPRILQQVPLTVLSDAECIGRYKALSTEPYTESFLPTNLICAGHKQKRANACMRDTGGPLQCLVNGAWVQYGILSLGNTCDDFAFYERVTSYLRWAEENILRKREERSADNECDGLQILEGTSGTVESPTIDGKYPNDMNCTWLIRAPAGHLLEIQFDFFDIEDHATCRYDRLVVYDGGNQNARMYMDEVLCGKNRTIAGFESSSNEVLLEFVTDDSTTLAGFRIRYNAVADCKADEFRCWDGSCIDDTKQCDGRSDCPKSSDEAECKHEDSRSVCGNQQTAPQIPWSSRIYGGSYAEKGSWPWQVYILDDRKTHQCGAAILSQEWILTAAHCTYLRPHFYVGIGGYDQSNRTGDQVIKIDPNQDVIIRHSNYDGDHLENGYDIAVIRPKEKIVLNDYAQPVCLPANGSKPISTESNCVATGWGLIKLNSFPSNILRQVRLPINSYEECEKANAAPYDPDLLFCGGVEGGRDTCIGDSGGPLVCFEDNNWFQYGIVSYGTDGKDCGQVGGAGFYTSVSYFSDWIRDATNGTYPTPPPPTERSTTPQTTQSTIETSSPTLLTSIMTTDSHTLSAQSTIETLSTANATKSTDSYITSDSSTSSITSTSGGDSNITKPAFTFSFFIVFLHVLYALLPNPFMH